MTLSLTCNTIIPPSQPPSSSLYPILYDRPNKKPTFAGINPDKSLKMQFLKLSVLLAFAAAAIATPIQLNTRSLYSCYKDVAADQVDCLEACGDTSATDCTNAW